MKAGYSPADAKEIVGVSQRCLEYWDERGLVRPSIRKAKGKGTERRYSYEDLVALSVLKRLRDTGLSLQKVIIHLTHQSETTAWKQGSRPKPNT